MTRIARITSIRRGLAASLGLFAACVAPAQLWAEPGRVRDLHYGQVLFEFYQEDYFSAIVELLAAEDRGRLSRSQPDAELLLGGLYLSYGLHDQADRIFHRVLDANADPEVRNRAWFFLAKIWYQRRYIDRALAALDSIGGKLPGALEAERRMLQAQALMAAGQYDPALSLLSGLDEEAEWSAFAKYNLGVAMARLGRVEDAHGLLNGVGKRPARGEEMLALRDKANVALGFALLQEDRPEEAKQILHRVRLEGPFSNNALLGVGWADSAMGNYQRALVPWMELRQRSTADSAVQESLLAIPYAMGKLEAEPQSARHYQFAIEAYTEEMGNLDLAVRRVREGVLIEELLAANDGAERGWFWQLEQLPDAAESRYLFQMLADHEFQEALKNFRDLVYMRDNLQDWSESISAFHDMLDTRREAFETRLPGIEETLGRVDLEAIEGRRLELATRLKSIETGRDHIALASNDEHARWKELEHIGERLEALPDSSEFDALREKHRVLRGVLYWQLNAAFPARLWRQRKAMRGLDKAVRKAQQRHYRVDLARQQMPERLEQFEARITAIEPRIRALQGQILTMMQQERGHLEMLATNELEARKQRIDAYLVQARFSLAAIYDRSVASAEVKR